MPSSLPNWLLYLLLTVAGGLMVLTFAPYSVHWSLALLLLFFLYQSIQHLTPRQGLFAGWGFGLCWVQ